MSKDILYKNENYVFSYRIGGVLIRDGKGASAKTKR